MGALINLASKFNIHVAFILRCPAVYCSTIRTLLPSGQTRLKKNVHCCFEDEGNIFVGNILYIHQDNSPFILIFHTSQDMWATTAQPLQNRVSSEESSPLKYLELELFLYYLRFHCFPPCLIPPGMLRHPTFTDT